MSMRVQNQTSSLVPTLVLGAIFGPCTILGRIYLLRQEAWFLNHAPYGTHFSDPMRLNLC